MGPGPSEAPTPRIVPHRAPYKPLIRTRDPTRQYSGRLRLPKRQKRGHRGPEREPGAISDYALTPETANCLDSRKERRSSCPIGRDLSVGPTEATDHGGASSLRFEHCPEIENSVGWQPPSTSWLDRRRNIIWNRPPRICGIFPTISPWPG